MSLFNKTNNPTQPLQPLHLMKSPSLLLGTQGYNLKHQKKLKHTSKPHEEDLEKTTTTTENNQPK